MLCPSCETPNRGDAKFCKKCGHSFLVEAAQVPEVAEVAEMVVTGQASAGADAAAQINADTDDPAFAPTQIISPQQMIEFHNRRWQQELEREQAATTEQSQAASEGRGQAIGRDEPAGRGQVIAPTMDEALDIADRPTLIINPAAGPEPATAIPIPPPPPGVSPAEKAPASSQPLSFAAATDDTGEPSRGDNLSSPFPPPSPFLPPPPPPPAEASAASPPVESPETVTTETTGEQPAAAVVTEAAETGQEPVITATTEKENDVVTPSDQLNQPTAAGDFPVLAVGAIVNERYEVTLVLSESAEEHVYSVTDHQGYQRCWNCNSQQNSEGDEFCIDCGAELLNAAYSMHEYPATKGSDADADAFNGTIVNTFVDQGPRFSTYAIVKVQVAENAFPTGVHLIAASDSDAGDVRRSEPNEDSTLVLLLQRVHESQSTPTGVFIVADGLGGHDNGQEASRLTINTIAERMARELLAAPLTSEKAGGTVEKTDEDSLISLLQSTIEDANAAICQVNQRDKTDMGSTITGFMVVSDYAYILNVGDSRTYMVRGGQIYQLTTDHSLVAQLVAGGLIEPDDVYTHPQRSQIFRSLGDKLNVQIDIFKQQVHPGDILLSCSDGLWEMVRNPQIESILNNAPDPQTACTQLLGAANTNGGEDNVSAIVVFVR
jgi:serine/threonine protein phosphatase PrpC